MATLQVPRGRTDSNKRLFGQVAVALGFCSQEQIDECLAAQKKLIEIGLPELIGAILVKKGYLDDAQVDTICQEMQDRPVLAGFEMLEKVGQGGMGAVFRARQLSMDRIVALKVLPKQLAADQKYKDRFLREARLSAKLSHPNLLQAIDVGEASGYMYYAMEFVEGRTLRQLVKERGALPLEETLEYLKQTCEGLAYAHQQHLIHRDIKPDNIMINARGEAKVCDLGLARKTGIDESDAGLTVAGKALGTPHYISPEQARGEQDLDHRTDIYSLGATLYHLLSGKTLFEGPTGASIMAMHLKETAPSLTEVSPNVPMAYARIVSKMLAKDPQDRYADLAEVLKDLGAAEKNRPLLAERFRATSSCDMPPVSNRSGRRRTVVGATTGPQRPIGARGSTTGPRAPIAGRGTTGPRAPIGPRHTTGPVKSIKPIRVTTGPADPVDGTKITAGLRRETKKKNSNGLLIGAGVGGLAVLLLLIVAFAGGSSNSTPREKTTAASPTTQPSTVPQPVAKPQVKPDAKQDEPRRTGPLSAEPAPQPEPEPSAPEMAPPVVEPAPAEPEAAPVEPQPEPATPAPQSEPEPEPAASVDPAEQEADPRIPALRTRFLTEALGRAQEKPLEDVRDAMRKIMVEDKQYAPAKDVLREDMADLDAAVKFEAAALKALADARGSLDLPEKMADTFGAREAKITGYDSSRGIAVSVKGAGLYFQGHQLPAEKVVAALAGRASQLDTAHYFLARGAFAPVRALLNDLKADDRARVAEKLDLLKAGEKEVAAQTAHAALQNDLDAKRWKELIAGIDAFRAEHAETAFAKQHADELAEWRETADAALMPPNPWKHVFHAAKVVTRKDGFVELHYDFTTPDQLKDFTCEHGQLTLNGGYMEIPRGGNEWAHARHIAPVGQVLALEAIGKTNSNAPRFGVYVLAPGSTDGSRSPVCMLRRYNQSGHLEFWEDDKGQVGNRMAVGNSKENWKKDTTFVAAVNGRAWDWTLNGQNLGKFNLPASHANGHIAFISVNGQHGWKKFSLIFQPEAKWAAEKLNDLKK